MSTLLPAPGTTATVADAAAVVRGTDLTKRYGEGAAAVHALRGVSVAFSRGTFTAIMGPSGSGKSTLLHVLAGLDTPTSGTVELDGTRLDALSDRELTLLRRRAIGFVFQSFNLLPVLTAAENVALPARTSVSTQAASGRPPPMRTGSVTFSAAVRTGSRLKL